MHIAPAVRQTASNVPVYREVDWRGMPIYPLMTRGQIDVEAKRRNARTVYHDSYRQARDAALKEGRR